MIIRISKVNQCSLSKKVSLLYSIDYNHKVNILKNNYYNHTYVLSISIILFARVSCDFHLLFDINASRLLLNKIEKLIRRRSLKAVKKYVTQQDKLRPWRGSKLVFKVIGITHCSCRHFMSAYYRQVSLNPS